MSKHKTPQDFGPAGSQRAQLRAQREAAEAAARKRKKIVTVAVIAGVAIVALVIALVVNKIHQKAIDDATAPDPNVEQIVPPNASDTNDSIVLFASAVKEGAIVVDVHSDYQCPWCKTYEDYFGSALFGLAQKGEIELRIHPRTLVGDRMLNNPWSVNAAIAATCADVVGRFPEYHNAAFAGQPVKEGDGFTTEQLSVTFAATAGITGDALTQFQACYAARATADWVAEAERISYETKVPGTRFENRIDATPTFLANGKLADLSQSGTTQEAVLQTLKDAANA
jgi:protein-disulfide isomerase